MNGYKCTVTSTRAYSKRLVKKIEGLMQWNLKEYNTLKDPILRGSMVAQSNQKIETVRRYIQDFD